MTAYGEWLESRSRELIATGLGDDESLRELLTLSVHSARGASDYFDAHLQDENLLERLVGIAIDEEGHEGDAPMAATHWLEQAPAFLLRRHGLRLLRGFPVVDAGHNGLLAMVLAKTGVDGAERRIADAHAAGLMDDYFRDRALERLTPHGKGP